MEWKHGHNLPVKGNWKKPLAIPVLYRISKAALQRILTIMQPFCVVLACWIQRIMDYQCSSITNSSTKIDEEPVSHKQIRKCYCFPKARRGDGTNGISFPACSGKIKNRSANVRWSWCSNTWSSRCVRPTTFRPRPPKVAASKWSCPPWTSRYGAASG